ncbi:hypothetical protein BKA65DRAFT_546515 [Rhexocercosporidium sp. MPI-PUGE-AT-0058]|nr:hypothetical protein BKA65DRAFT_546515 [Rhexocercosporidium sp. MPI-PUGE-AT-0058]
MNVPPRGRGGRERGRGGTRGGRGGSSGGRGRGRGRGGGGDLGNPANPHGFMNFVPDGRRTQDEWRQMQQDYASARARKLTNLYKAEILHDIEMLKKPWTHEDGDPPTDDDPFGHPKINAALALANGLQPTQEHTLEWLKQYACTYLDSEDHIRYRPRDTTIERIDKDANEKKRAENDDDDTYWVLIARSYTLLQRLRVLRRFADGRNLAVSEAPLSDASNFEGSNHFLAATWILHRCYIRLLHQRSLYVGKDNVGERMLEKILKISMAYLSLELDKVPNDPEVAQQNLPSFADINFMYQQLMRAIKGIADGVQFETRTGFYSTEDTVSFNTAPARISAIVEMNLQPVLGRWYLWSDLQDLNEDFTRRMGIEHVEDVLTNKLVVISDEEYVIMDELRVEGDGYVPASLRKPKYPPLPKAKQELFQKPQKYIDKISQVNQFRRNLLLLKDWNRKRPWKQLYCPYNTSENGDYGPKSADPRRRTFLNDIIHFQNHLEALHLAKPQVIPRTIHYNKDFNPSNEANVYSNLFPIHPLASTAIPVVNDSIPGRMTQDDWDAGCALCGDEYDVLSRKIIMQTHCNHFFHYSCLRTNWDLPDNQHYNCPLCRQSNWRLKETASITAEVSDVWEYEERMGRQWVEGDPFNADSIPHPDISEEYHRIEESVRLTSQYYRPAKRGYPTMDFEYDPDNPQGQYTGMYGIERTAYVEMAVVREYRRALNRRRRLAVEQAETGIKDIDPEDPNPDGIPPVVIPKLVTVNPEPLPPASPGVDGGDGSDGDNGVGPAGPGVSNGADADSDDDNNSP